MNKRDLIIELRRIEDNIKQLTPHSLFRDYLNAQSLSPYQKIHEDFTEKLKLYIENGDLISTNYLRNIKTIYDSYFGLLIDIKSYPDSVYVNKRNEIIEKLEIRIDNLQELWHKLVGVIDDKKKSDEFKYLIESVKKDKELINSELKEIRSLKNSLEQQSKEYKTRYESINTNVELETQVNIFEEQALKNLEDANKWLIASIASGVLLVGILIWFYFDFEIICKQAKEYIDYKAVCNNCGQQILWVDMIRSVLFRFLILSAVIYSLSFCVKNYNACMHNKTNNNHRHNSFAAALHFYNTTTGEKREEILIKVADAIFTYQKSGYYGKNNEPANPSIIQSVIERVSGKTE